MSSLRLGILASGRGSNLQALLDASAKRWISSRVAVVVSDVPEAKALDRARAVKVPAEGIAPSAAVRGPERRRLHERQMLKVLHHFEIDLVVLAGYMRILGPDLIRAYPQRIVNVHPALLPSFPGLNAQRQALEWGARVAGATTHFVDEQVDHGPVILQGAVPARRDDTEDSLSARILEVEHQLLPRTVNLIEEGRVRVEGRRVHIDPGPSWKTRLPVLPDVLYGDGY
ncbi:MAG: phosphoribosylglycinamide formyltransferase [Euryarchaeota archaeon]|nr:phosphoribosylglycinamide formyltransferase [Euryarchaeota archaeon]